MGDSVPLGSASTPEKTRRVFQGMHTWKAPGHDSLLAELLKIDGRAEPIVVKRYYAILVKMCNGGEVPQERKDATKMLYKKPDLFNRNNYKWLL